MIKDLSAEIKHIIYLWDNYELSDYIAAIGKSYFLVLLSMVFDNQIDVSAEEYGYISEIYQNTIIGEYD